MMVFLTSIPFAKIGWAVLQLAWISSLYLGGIIIVLKLLSQFSAGLKYNIGMGGLLFLPIIPLFLFMEHRGVLPPLGFANWGSATQVGWEVEPLIQGIPKFSPMELGLFGPELYYWLGLVWLSITTIGVAYYLLSMVREQLICIRKPRIDDQEIHSLITDLAEKVGIKRSIQLRASSFRDGPAVVGITRPILLIPTSLPREYSREEQEAIFLHELMHIKRWDYLFVFLQKIIQSLFFFQPLVWWLNRILNLEREHLCDRRVTEITRDTYSYGKSLAKLLLQTQAALTHTLNIAEHPVLQRIRKLTDQKEEVSLSVKEIFKRAIAFIVMAMTIFLTLWNAYHMHPTHKEELHSVELVYGQK